jgi:hypothetical protein
LTRVILPIFPTMLERRAMARKPKPPASVPTPEQLKAKLAELEVLRKKLKAAAGGPGAKKKKKPRFSGSWGCGGA